MVKRIVIVAYHAPPSNATGIFRTLGFIGHLAKMGWQITLVTTTVNALDSENDELLRKIPASVRIVRVRDWNVFALWERVRKPAARSPDNNAERLNSPTASPANGWLHSARELLTTILKTPDPQIGWLLPAALRCVLLTKPAIVYSSAPPFTGHLIGLICKYFWRVPLVCDFRDPWIDNPFRREKLPLAERWDCWLERQIFSKADLIVANTEKAATIFRQKTLRSPREIITIPNGYDPEDFLEVKQLRDYPGDELLLVHAGMLYGERNPLNFLKGLALLTEQNACPKLQILFIGASALVEGVPLEQCITDMGLSSCVRTQAPVSHATVLSLMKGADALLLLALGTTLQVPAKLFEYFGLERPILSIAEPASATEEITNQLPGLIFTAHNEPESIQTALFALYAAWEAGRLKARHEGGGCSLLKTMQRQHQTGVLARHLGTLINRKER